MTRPRNPSDPSSVTTTYSTSFGQAEAGSSCEAVRAPIIAVTWCPCASATSARSTIGATPTPPATSSRFPEPAGSRKPFPSGP